MTLRADLFKSNVVGRPCALENEASMIFREFDEFSLAADCADARDSSGKTRLVNSYLINYLPLIEILIVSVWGHF